MLPRRVGRDLRAYRRSRDATQLQNRLALDMRGLPGDTQPTRPAVYVCSRQIPPARQL